MATRESLEEYQAMFEQAPEGIAKLSNQIKKSMMGKLKK